MLTLADCEASFFVFAAAVVAVVAALSSEALSHTMGIVLLANQRSEAFCDLVASRTQGRKN